MENEIAEMCKQMSKDRLQRLLYGLQHIHEPVLTTEVDEQNQNKTNMASFSEVVSNNNRTSDSHDTPSKIDETNDPSNFVKPIFLKDVDVHGLTKPERSLWLTNVEIYRAIDEKIPAERIKGIQRIREMWRIYIDNEEDKLSLLVSGINLRGRQVPLYSQNPRNPGFLRPDTIRIKVRNVPISADDGQIHRALELHGSDIQGFFRERLRVNGKLTNCQTGDRIVISKILEQPIPRNIQIGKYMAIVLHSGQPEFQNRKGDGEGNVKTCHKCLQPGHLMAHCSSDWVCKTCKIPGHKMIDCPSALQDDNSTQYQEQDNDNVANDDNSQPTTEVKESQVSNEVQIPEKTIVTIEKEPGSKPNLDKQNAQKPSQAKTVSGAKTNISSGINKSQPSMDRFVTTPMTQRRNPKTHHTPPTPPDQMHDGAGGSNGPKKTKI